MTEPGRRFTEEEFAEILRRASELQARLPAPGDEGPGDAAGAGASRSPGMSLAEMESIGREVGIEPALVRRAASALVAEEARFTGGADGRFVLKRTAPGEVSPDDLARVLNAVRDAAPVHGETGPTHSGVEWKGGDVVRTVVTADTLDGGTELRVAVDANSAKVLSHLFPTMAGLLGSVAVGATLEPGLAGGIATIGGGLLTGLGAGRLIWKRALNRARENAARIFRAGSAALDRGVAGDPGEGGSASGSPD